MAKRASFEMSGRVRRLPSTVIKRGRKPLGVAVRTSVVLLVIGVAGSLLAPLASGNQPRPNVLFLAVDDMNDWVGCLGGYRGRVHTPHIDRLAQTGVLFTSAHCPSPKCAPSRAAIMTGLRPSQTGLYDNGHWWYPNCPDVVTIPAHFRRHGYHVCGSGKIFHHTAGNHPPNQWDDYLPLRFQNDRWFRESRLNYPWTQPQPFPRGYPFSGVDGLPHENDWGTLPIRESDYDDAKSVDYAVGFLSREHDKPFFLACGLFRPHLPWYAPADYFRLYPIDRVQLPDAPEDDLDDVPDAGREFSKARRSDFRRIRHSNKWREAVQAYLASISFADAQLGRVLAALDSSPHAESTIVILWSDHGWHLGEKQHWHKSTLWEEATRVPLIIRAPGHSPRICDPPVSLVDLFPTLVELCGLEWPGPLSGQSLVPLLDATPTDWPRPAVTEFRRGNAAVRSRHFRYIRYADGGEELYDHRSDPGERHNLAGRAELASVKATLAKWLPKEWAASAPTKKEFEFDSSNFTWIRKSDGETISGARP